MSARSLLVAVLLVLGGAGYQAGAAPDARAADGYTVQSILSHPEGHNAMRISLVAGPASTPAWPIGMDGIDALIREADGSLRMVRFGASAEAWLSWFAADDVLYVSFAHGFDAQAILDMRVRAAPLVCGEGWCAPDTARAFVVGSYQNDYRGGPAYLDAADSIPQFVPID